MDYITYFVPFSPRMNNSTHFVRRRWLEIDRSRLNPPGLELQADDLLESNRLIWKADDFRSGMLD